MFYTHNQITIDLELTYKNPIQNNRSIPCVNNKTFHGKQIEEIIRRGSK